VNVWLINTGWTGGAYGTGNRMKLSYTRAMITAALQGKLNNIEYNNLPIFNLAVPKQCPGVPDTLLDPKNTWDDKHAYDRQAQMLAGLFNKNFEKYAAGVTEDIRAASPIV
jgi:phosphoenolpyruvate carboxykinase (ATP)